MRACVRACVRASKTAPASNPGDSQHLKHHRYAHKHHTHAHTDTHLECDRCACCVPRENAELLRPVLSAADGRLLLAGLLVLVVGRACVQHGLRGGCGRGRALAHLLLASEDELHSDSMLLSLCFCLYALSYVPLRI